MNVLLQVLAACPSLSPSLDQFKGIHNDLTSSFYQHLHLLATPYAWRGRISVTFTEQLLLSISAASISQGNQDFSKGSQSFDYFFERLFATLPSHASAPFHALLSFCSGVKQSCHGVCLEVLCCTIPSLLKNKTKLQM